MIYAFCKRALLLLAVISVLFTAGAGADDIQIPDMGSPADAILNKTTEAQIGRAIMRDIRRSGMLVEDPQITEYINEIGHRIAAQTNEGDHSFTFFVVDDPRINAFALPGGYIGSTHRADRRDAKRGRTGRRTRARSRARHAAPYSARKFMRTSDRAC